MKFLSQHASRHAFDHRLQGVKDFWYRLNVHTFNNHHPESSRLLASASNREEGLKDG
jgi:hypothetical protein